jgi:hypothetical protein
MARDKSPSQALFDDIVNRAVASVLKPRGFRKSALNFHRRHKDVVQVVNLQSSNASAWDEKHFYVNVGLAFDAICRLTDTGILEQPKEHDCDSRGTRDRLENLLDSMPDRWSVDVNGDSDAVAEQLRDAIEELAAELESIDGVPAYRDHRWFDRFRPKQENAQILYLLGDLDGAWKEVRDLCTLFSDRETVNRPEWWLKELGLTGLTAEAERERGPLKRTDAQ